MRAGFVVAERGTRKSGETRTTAAKAVLFLFLLCCPGRSKARPLLHPALVDATGTTQGLACALLSSLNSPKV